MMYKLLPNNRTTNEPAKSVMRINADNSETHIPFAPDNTDYQAYLKFLEEGGQPLPAEENQ